MSIDSLQSSIPGENTPLPVFEKIVRLPSGGVSYACSNPGHFAEHTDPHLDALNTSTWGANIIRTENRVKLKSLTT